MRAELDAAGNPNWFVRRQTAGSFITLGTNTTRGDITGVSKVMNHTVLLQGFSWSYTWAAGSEGLLMSWVTNGGTGTTNTFWSHTATAAGTYYGDVVLKAGGGLGTTGQKPDSLVLGILGTPSNVSVTAYGTLLSSERPIFINVTGAAIAL